MFKNYFIAAWRNIRKHKVFSYINLGGLATGITAVLLIGMYIESELTYDNFHSNRNNIYRVGFRTWQQGIMMGESPEFTAPFSVEAKNLFPEIKSYCRVSENHEEWLSYTDKNIKTSKITYADSSFFTVFSFRLLSGNSVNALRDPNSIVLSQQLADKLFGNTDAVGKLISLGSKANYLVTGIVQNAPPNSTLQYDALLSISTLYHDTTYFMDWNGGWQYQHYLLLQNKTGAESLQKQFAGFLQKSFNQKYSGGSTVEAFLQPLAKLHLYYSPDAANTRTNLYVFGIVALLILFVSCINYVNLSAARASARFKEIGVRKVLGAQRMQLIKQFMGETFLVTLCALLLAAGLTLFLLPVYQDLSEKQIILSINEIGFIGALMVALMVLISLFAGGYLSFYLSSLNPVNTLKMKGPRNSKQRLGKILIILQFSITTALLSSVFILHMQLRYAKNKALGLDKEQVIILPLTGGTMQDKALLLKRQVAGLANVTSVSVLSEIPYNGITQNGFLPEGSKDYITVHQLDADEDLLKTLHIQLLNGSFFSGDRSADFDGYIINQALADNLGWKEPLDKTISRNGRHRIIGVVSNFHFASLHDKIEPLIITHKPYMNRYGFLAIKYNPGNPARMIDQLHTVWKQTAVGAPFDYWFLDEAFNHLYKSEERFMQLFLCFSLLSILLSLAGVFGLVLLIIQQKTKEIGIRKVLGAGLRDIIRLTAGKFLVLILVASLIAVPAALYYSSTWLQKFAYRIEMKWWMFVMPGIVVLVFALLVIGIETGKAAAANTVKSLRTD
ncbi:MAG: ABC transporter permease [Bacteroidota bacterium]|nr:ABC transporter permease [Bacteroidota bacterium]